MDGLDTEASFMDELLDFSSDIGEQEDDDDKMMNTNKRPRKALSPLNHNATTTAFDVFDSLQPSPSPFPVSFIFLSLSLSLSFPVLGFIGKAEFCLYSVVFAELTGFDSDEL